MKVNGRVVYTDPKGRRHAATITGVVDTGLTGKKMLDLRLENDAVVARVPHLNDRAQGNGGTWDLVTPENPLPEQRAPIEKQLVEMAEALDEERLPEVDRRAPEVPEE